MTTLGEKGTVKAETGRQPGLSGHTVAQAVDAKKFLEETSLCSTTTQTKQSEKPCC